VPGDDVTAAHLPDDAPLPPVPRGVLPLDIDLGSRAGQRLVLLSMEMWDGWADLRFARIDVGATQRLARRVPPVDAWAASVDGVPLTIFDAVGRGDRRFSNGEVRLVPAPPPGSTLSIPVQVVPGTEPLRGTLALPAASDRPEG
jgi:hypothetical protein